MNRTRLHIARIVSSVLMASSSLCAGVAVQGCGTSPVAHDEATAAQALAAIPSYVVDASQTSVSGLSSGAFMAVQFHVAYSSTVRSAAIFAGGPYDCAQGSQATAVTTCMSQTSALDPAPYIARTKDRAAARAIDAVENLAAARVFLFGGADDTTVHPAVMDALESYYRSFVTAGDVTYEKRHPGTAHTMPTAMYGGDCDKTSSPYIGKCNYDGARQALAEAYGPLEAAASSLTGTYVTIPQGAFVADPKAHSLADSAYAYVPRSCAAGETCRIHVAFHGCLQNVASIGDAFYKHAGYNEWADTNHVIVLYPQTVDTSGSNPNGCWDWFGYDSADYATKAGPQMAMVKAMIDHLAKGLAPVADGGTDAGGYDAGAPSAPDAGPAAPSSTCVLASNASHVAEGRARELYGFAYANGSNELLGAANPYVWMSLRALGSSWVIDACR